jgi:competence protein ComEC
LLSIAATAALIGQPTAGSSALHNLRALTRLNVRTTLATAPLVYWSFGSVPLFGLLANLLLVPVGSLLLLLACGHALVAYALPFLTSWSALPLAISARAFLRGAGAFSSLGPQLALPPLTLAQGIVFALGTAGLLFAQKPRRKLWLALAAVSCAGFEEWRVRHSEKPMHELRATFVDVGQGDAAIIDLPNGEVMLIDAGGNPQGGPDPGARALLPLLAARRRAQLDTVVLTHPHPDHYGGLEAIIEALPIRELWDSGQSAAEAELIDTTKAALALLERARARGTRVLAPEQLCGRPRHYGAATVRVLAPCPSYDSGFDPNDNSLVVRIDYAGRSLLFAGDIEAHAEQKLLADAAPLRSDILKVPHHGSRTSSSEPLLQAVQPQLAIISAGASNPFGHPHPEVVERLRRHAGQVIDLGESGGTIVRIHSSGELSIETSLPP